MSDYHEMFDNFLDGMEGYLREGDLPEDPTLREQEYQERDQEYERDRDW